MEQNQNTIKQTENFGEIIGLLKKKNIKFGQSTKEGITKNYANGSLEVEVKNEHGVNVLKVDVMQMELKANGESNKNYKALQTIANEYKSIEENGAEEADLIQVFVKVEENNYYNREDDKVMEGSKIVSSTNFDKKIFAPIKRVADKNTPHKATISFGGMVTKVTANEQTGELKVDIVGADYNGQAVKHKLDVSKELAGHFRGIYQEGAVTTLHYMAVNAVEVKEVKSEVAFGNAPTYTIENFTRKNLICGGDTVNYASEMTQEVVTKMLQIREVKLAKVKDDAIKRDSEKASGAGAMPQNAFGATGATNPPVGNTPFGGGNPFGGGATPNTNPFGG